MLKTLLKKMIPKQILEYRRYLAREKEYVLWQKSGTTLPPPAIAKQKTLAAYQKKYGLNTLIETGTYYGGTIDHLKKNFTRLISIEINQDLYRLAKSKFEKYPHIQLYQGDSGTLLPAILKDIHEPCLFWLDGHYSGGITGKGELNTPVFKELAAVYHSRADHVILIDDARLFTGKDDYPTVLDLQKFVLNLNPDILFEVQNDMIRITPKI